jgi:hypothetical protein
LTNLCSLDSGHIETNTAEKNAAIYLEHQINRRFAMFKSLVPVIVIASALAAPSFAFAQNSSPITRSEVKAELVQFEQAGYKPDSGDNATYPVSIQAAAQRMSTPNGETATSYGSPSNGTSHAGVRTVVPATNDPQSVYFGR